MVYNIEFYAYLPNIWIYIFLHFDLRSDPDFFKPDPDFFPAGSGSVVKNVGSSSLVSIRPLTSMILCMPSSVLDVLAKYDFSRHFHDYDL